MSGREPRDPSQRALDGADEALLLDAARLDDLQARARRELAVERVASRWREGRRSRAWTLALPCVGLAAASFWLASPVQTRMAAEPSRRPASALDDGRPVLLRPACPNIVRAEPTLALIDDMEDGDASILARDARFGAWRLVFDGTGSVTPFAGNFEPAAIPGGRGASQMALHVTGGKLREWGAFATASLTPAGCYDASAYAGLEFWARGSQRLRIGVVMMDVVSTLVGGPCAENCNQSHVAVIELSADWKQYSLRWADLEQERSPAMPQQKGYVELDLRRLSSVTFGVSPDDTPFDVWVDDLAFSPP